MTFHPQKAFLRLGKGKSVGRIYQTMGWKVRGLEHLYLLKPGPCWSGEDPRMAEKDDHVGRNPERRCTDTEAQEYGRNKCDSKTLILSHGRRQLKAAIEWQLLGH